ncbi:hypothetical protein TNCV_2430271 [Trichonephila clavipes]|nr:hypothetical protein TNCV_2430271 [Trichonephila clavipes]
MDVFKCMISFALHGSTLNCRRGGPSCGWWKGVEGGEPLACPQVSSLKFGVETSQIACHLSRAAFAFVRDGKTVKASPVIYTYDNLASMSSDAIRNNCNGYMKTYDECSEKVFALLPVLGKKAVLDWCIKEGLIGSSYVCPKCGES